MLLAFNFTLRGDELSYDDGINGGRISEAPLNLDCDAITWSETPLLSPGPPIQLLLHYISIKLNPTTNLSNLTPKKNHDTMNFCGERNIHDANGSTIHNMN